MRADEGRKETSPGEGRREYPPSDPASDRRALAGESSVRRHLRVCCHSNGERPVFIMDYMCRNFSVSSETTAHSSHIQPAT